MSVCQTQISLFLSQRSIKEISFLEFILALEFLVHLGRAIDWAKLRWVMADLFANYLVLELLMVEGRFDFWVSESYQDQGLFPEYIAISE
ncbi:hypothetical protein C2S51_012266 [Perilla frutescens var. frutescens]|nr:hypothetical protein C2S51_012266 [Perilla frutescens var. frutescens]